MSLRLSYDIKESPNLQRHIQGYILLELQEMASSEILSHIPDHIQARIKRDDPNPLFRAYVVAHEGPSQGHIVGVGQMVKHWVQSAIRKIFDGLKTGLQLFHNHSETNQHEGRISIGELVGKTTSYIKGKLTAIAIAYIKPEFRSLPLDVASIEADITIPPGEKLEGPNVDRITGIALGNSKINKPGFSGAELIGELQAFVEKSQPKRRALQMGENDKITKEELKNLIKDENLKPSDIFSNEQIAQDPFVIGFADSQVQKRIGQEYQHRKSKEEELTKKEQDWEKEKDKMSKTISDLKKTASESKVKSLFETAKEKRKLSDQQSKFIEKRLKSFNPDDLENIEKELDNHLDLELDEFKSYAETFGLDVSEASDNGDDDKSKEKAKPKIKAEPGKDDSGGIDNPYLPPLDD